MENINEIIGDVLVQWRGVWVEDGQLLELVRENVERCERELICHLGSDYCSPEEMHDIAVQIAHKA